MPTESTTTANVFSTKEARFQFITQPSIYSIRRWATDGVRVDGRTVKLKRFREGGRYCYRLEDIEEFKKQLQTQ